MEDRIETRHPDPSKAGVRISKARYEAIRQAILAALRERGPLPFMALPGEVSMRLPDFDGSVGWYVTTVKLDLEARGAIERVPGASPQVLRLVE